MSDDIILTSIARFLTPFVLLFAFYVQWHGEYSPGGGFQAGVIFAAVFILHGLLHGVRATMVIVPMVAVRMGAVMGVLLYGGVGVWTLIKGGAYLDYNVLAASGPAGQKLGIMLVEAGVGITVASVMLLFFYAFTHWEEEEGD